LINLSRTRFFSLKRSGNNDLTGPIPSFKIIKESSLPDSHEGCVNFPNPFTKFFFLKADKIISKRVSTVLQSLRKEILDTSSGAILSLGNDALDETKDIVYPSRNFPYGSSSSIDLAGKDALEFKDAEFIVLEHLNTLSLCKCVMKL